MSMSNDPAGALLEAQELLAPYFSASRTGLAILDNDLRFVAVNQTLAEMNGIPAEEHLGRGLREILGDFAEVIEPQIKRALETRQPVLNFEVSTLPPAGSEPSHRIGHYIPISDAAGEVKRVAAIVVEVTEQKKLEESLQGVSDRLRDEKKRLQVMVEVSRVLAEKLDVVEIFPQVSANLRRILRQEYAALALRDEQSGRLVRLAMDFPLRKGLLFIDPESDASIDPSEKAMRERAPLIFTKDQIREFPPGTTGPFLSEGLQSLCCVPLLRPKGALGVLVLGSTRAEAFKSDDLILVNQVAAQLAVALENMRSARELKRLRAHLEQEKLYVEGEGHGPPHFEEIIGESPVLKLVLQQVSVVAPSDATVLVLGETGTGKGLVARAIHHSSKRKERNFLTLNCAAIPTGLLESELFGHEKGAFTGAVSQKIGRLELADKGTVFSR